MDWGRNPGRWILATLVVLGACGGDDGETTTDPGASRDLVMDPSPADPGMSDPGLADQAPADQGPADPGAPPSDPGADPGRDEGTLPDPGDDPGPVDPGLSDLPGDSGPVQDVPAEEWPPKEPWWGNKECRLPACDPGAPQDIDLSGLWTQTLTAVRHDCNPLVETLKPEIKPGTVTTKPDQTFTVQGTCTYSGPGGTVTGVLKGDTMINCILMPPEQGVTAMPTGWITFSNGTGSGKSTVHLYGIPMLQPSNCSIEYDVAYARQ